MVNTDSCDNLCAPYSSRAGQACINTIVVCEPCCVVTETVRTYDMPHCLFCSMVTGQAFNNGSMCDSHKRIRSPEVRSREALGSDAHSRRSRSPDGSSRHALGSVGARSPDSRYQGCFYCDRTFYNMDVAESTAEHLRTRDTHLTNDLPVMPLTLEKANKIRQFVAQRCGLIDCPEFMDAPYHSSIVVTKRAESETSNEDLYSKRERGFSLTKVNNISSDDSRDWTRQSASSSVRSFSGKREKERESNTSSINNNVRYNSDKPRDAQKPDSPRASARSNSNKSEDVEKTVPAPSYARSNSNKSGDVEKPAPVRSNSSTPGAVEKPVPAPGSVRSMSLSGSSGKRGSIVHVSGPPSLHDSTVRRMSAGVAVATSEKESTASPADAVNIPAALAEEEEEDGEADESHKSVGK